VSIFSSVTVVTHFPKLQPLDLALPALSLVEDLDPEPPVP